MSLCCVESWSLCFHTTTQYLQCSHFRSKWIEYCGGRIGETGCQEQREEQSLALCISEKEACEEKAPLSLGCEWWQGGESSQVCGPSHDPGHSGFGQNLGCAECRANPSPCCLHLFCVCHWTPGCPRGMSNVLPGGLLATWAADCCDKMLSLKKPPHGPVQEHLCSGKGSAASVLFVSRQTLSVSRNKQGHF